MVLWLTEHRPPSLKVQKRFGLADFVEFACRFRREGDVCERTGGVRAFTSTFRKRDCVMITMSIGEMGDNFTDGGAIDGASRTGYGFTVGTVAQLIAQGPSQPCAGCTLAPTTSDGGRTMPRKDGLFSQRGWVVLCGRHLQARRDEASSFTASTTAPVPMPTPAVSRASRAQQSVVSISTRWKRQVKKQQRRQQKRAFNRTSTAATGDSPTGALPCETAAALACQG